MVLYDVYGVEDFKDIVLYLFFMYFLQYRRKYIYILPLPFYLTPSPQFWKIIGLFILIRDVQSAVKEEDSFFCFFFTCLDSAVRPEVCGGLTLPGC